MAFTKTKTVDSILSSFSKGLKELAELVKSETATAQKETTDAAALIASADARRKETDRATTVINNLNTLLGNPPHDAVVITPID